MSSQVERGTVREMVHAIAFRAGVLERILQEPVLGSLEIRADELAHVQLLQRQIDDLRRYLNLPSAEPERKKGEWIPIDSFSAFGGDEALWMAHGDPVAFYYCSNCKKQAYAGEDGQSLITDFCPFCGAEMRGE